MQQIATSKSNLAALGVPSEKEILPIPSRAEEFRQLLRDNDKQLGYASPVEPVGTAAEAKHTKNQFEPPSEDVNSGQQSNSADENKQALDEQLSKDKESEAKVSDQPKQEKATETEQQVVAREGNTPEESATPQGPDETEESVDWLQLLQRANENQLKLESSTNTKATPGVIPEVESNGGSAETVGTQIEISVQNVVSELTLEGLEKDPLYNMVNEVSELPEIPESLAIELTKLLTKLESGKTDLNIDDLDEQQLANLHQAVEQWLANQSEQGPGDEKGEPVDLSILLDVLKVTPTEDASSPQVPISELTDEEVKDLLAQGLEKLDIPADMQALLNLSEKKLDAVLTKLAENLNIAKVEGEKQSRLAGMENQLDKVSDSAAAEVKSEFIATLKVGVEEIKSQIKQGHQPALDLKALINETINKMSKAEQIVDVPAEKVDQVMASLTRTLDVAQMLSASQDPQAIQATTYDRMANRESSVQAVVEQTRQQQPNAVNDKGINITKPEGHQQMADKVRWMVNSNNMHADIRLDPPELGSMQIRVNLSGEAASVSFVVQSQQAREVLEQATPRLKELLEEQGIELGQSSVQQESGDDAANGEGELAGNTKGQSEEPEDTNSGIEQRVVNGSLSGIDYYV